MVACSPAPTAPTATPSAPVPFPPGVVAQWDAGSVSATEVRAATSRLPLGLREQYATANGQRDFIDAVIAQKLLRNEAHRLELDKRDDIRRQVDELEDRLTVQALVADAERRLGPPTEAELKDYYARHESEFRTGLRVRVSRVLLIGKPDAALRKKADALRSRLLAKEAFEKVATAGQGPERVRNGDLGWITEASDPETTVALGLVKIGEVSPVIETPTGFGVLVLTAREEAHVPPFEEVRELLVGRIGASRQRKAFDELVKRLREEAHVQFNPAGLQ